MHEAFSVKVENDKKVNKKESISHTYSTKPIPI